jgi:hypothetical protein
VLLEAVFALTPTAAATTWEIMRHTDCSAKGAVTWKMSFAGCRKHVGGESFMYTNEHWPASNAGCIVDITPSCDYNCTVGACENWDSYYCQSGACAADPAPPPVGMPGPTPFPPASLVHNASKQTVQGSGVASHPFREPGFCTVADA